MTMTSAQLSGTSIKAALVSCARVVLNASARGWSYLQAKSVNLFRQMSAQPPPYPNEKDGYGVEAGKPLMVAAMSSSGGDVRLSPDPLNRIYLETRFADVTGTYYVAPHSIVPEVNVRRRKRQKRKQTPDAIFRSRRGNLSLDLGTIGYASENAKASVNASTKSGNISLNLIAGAKVRPRFDVEVNTRTGHVVLFVTETFSGAIQLHTNRGQLEFLPGITAEMRVIKSTDTEYLVLVGPQPVGAEQPPADYCRVQTRSGNIKVGLRGKDVYVQPFGLWQRLTSFIRN
ncbi:hypothetical protein MIND_00354700 [Mycena indigotica]|uniref:DUF7330 domain-containing protein n=1 Tax=Mycena indigotica TaxID=2126181 RepID=A0A8H6WCJ7_9AGAR|nr:uncharacterized protein MIND_00354700 [Mycena indigotica]KAF7309828.1 hypothetical protein MIND_00354700 [Mycena indigotica]